MPQKMTFQIEWYDVWKPFLKEEEDGMSKTTTHVSKNSQVWQHIVPENKNISATDEMQLV